MKNDELAARIIVLEAMTIASLGAAIRFGRAVLPPQEVVSILDAVKAAAQSRIQSEQLSSAGMAEGARYLDYVLSEFSEHVIPRKSNPGSQRADDKD